MGHEAARPLPPLLVVGLCSVTQRLVGHTAAQPLLLWVVVGLVPALWRLEAHVAARLPPLRVGFGLIPATRHLEAHATAWPLPLWVVAHHCHVAPGGACGGSHPATTQAGGSQPSRPHGVWKRTRRLGNSPQQPCLCLCGQRKALHDLGAWRAALAGARSDSATASCVAAGLALFSPTGRVAHVGAGGGPATAPAAGCLGAKGAQHER